MRVTSVRTLMEEVLLPSRQVDDLYIVLDAHLPYGFCLDELSTDECKQILIDAGRSPEVQRAIIGQVKFLLDAAGHNVDWEG